MSPNSSGKRFGEFWAILGNSGKTWEFPDFWEIMGNFGKIPDFPKKNQKTSAHSVK